MCDILIDNYIERIRYLILKLSISNIAWSENEDEQVYSLMQKYGFTGLEIAPTRIFPSEPYGDLDRVREWAKSLENGYGFVIPSMQSIWFGRQEKLFGSSKEREILSDYTKKAVDFASAAGCSNLVFGCPRNRALPEGADRNAGREFFHELGEYALSKSTDKNRIYIGMEANPLIYNTNYINTTAEALELIREVGSDGFKLNLDVGTMIENHEDISVIEGKIPMISHVHISEPYLKTIEKRTFHKELKCCLEEGGYDGFISIEMGNQADNEDKLKVIEYTMAYVREIFG